jgi:CelD/BcsL family acetyltransferase involved in cellulose biosynthesis
MSIEIETLDGSDRDEWNRHVERSPHSGVFHRFEALETLAEYAKATLTPLVGYKGQEPVGLFPAFCIRKGFVNSVVSPPPALHVPYLGPALLNMDKLKQRKAERRQRRFVDAVIDAIEAAHDPRYVHMRIDHAYPDLRPFMWADFRVTPRHTYLVDLTRDEEALLSSFSSDARSNVRNADPDAYEIAVEGRDAIDRILEQVRERFADQGMDFALPTGLAGDLYDRLPDGAVRPFVCRVDGAFVGGIVALDDGRRVYRWQGGVGGGDVDLPVNDLLDWRVMTDAMERGTEHYDLVGADTRRINRYKSKFGPELQTFHALERGSLFVSLLARGYRSLS